MKKDFKVLEFMYQDSEIHFLINDQNDNVMVNATEMAKAFGKRTKDYLANKSTKDLIYELEQTLNSVHSDVNILSNRGHSGIFFHRILALDFATWLDVKFKIWVYQTIEKVLFANYKKHWDAHLLQEQAKKDMDIYKQKILLNANQDDVVSYFEAENKFKQAKATKLQAIQNQYKMAL